MKAKPLEWKYDQFGGAEAFGVDDDRYSVEDYTCDDAGFEATLNACEAIGDDSYPSLSAAQAACEAHHQQAFAEFVKRWGA